MKYLKVYKEFYKGSELYIESNFVEKPNVDDFDWQYFFQELLDDFDITIQPKGYDKYTNSFHFVVKNQNNKKTLSKTTYFTNKDKHIKREPVDEVLIKIIERVESLGGSISIVPSFIGRQLDIKINIDTFETFRK